MIFFNVVPNYKHELLFVQIKIFLYAFTLIPAFFYQCLCSTFSNDTRETMLLAHVAPTWLLWWYSIWLPSQAALFFLQTLLDWFCGGDPVDISGAERVVTATTGEIKHYCTRMTQANVIICGKMSAWKS